MMWLSTLVRFLVLFQMWYKLEHLTPKQTSYPDIECDGLPLFKAQVQFWSWIPELGAFTDFILLFHPSASRQTDQHRYTEIDKASQQFSGETTACSVQQVHCTSQQRQQTTQSLLTWNGPAEPRWSQKRHPGRQNQLLWTHCDLRAIEDVTGHEQQST